jgi:hypothetical protein
VNSSYDDCLFFLRYWLRRKLELLKEMKTTEFLTSPHFTAVSNRADYWFDLLMKTFPKSL